MKKIRTILTCLIMMFSFNSCSNQKANKEDVFMLQGNMDNVSTIELEANELKEMIENEESFALIVTLLSCSSCERFLSAIVNPYIEETYSTIYTITSAKLDSSASYDNKPTYKTAPTILLYKEGKKVSSLNYKEKDETFTSLEGFKKYMNTHVVEPNLITISEEKLDAKFASNDSFLLYIGWNKCGDCKKLEELVLKDYLCDNKYNDVIYYLESDEYRSTKPRSQPVEEDYESNEEYLIQLNYYNKWIDFATKYNFVSYREGKVPTLQYYKDGKLVDMLVYNNDVIENGIITTSYFEELVNKEYTSESLLEVHNQKALEFLNKYYK